MESSGKRKKPAEVKAAPQAGWRYKNLDSLDGFAYCETYNRTVVDTVLNEIDDMRALWTQGIVQSGFEMPVKNLSFRLAYPNCPATYFSSRRRRPRRLPGAPQDILGIVP